MTTLGVTVPALEAGGLAVVGVEVVVWAAGADCVPSGADLTSHAVSANPRTAPTVMQRRAASVRRGAITRMFSAAAAPDVGISRQRELVPHVPLGNRSWLLLDHLDVGEDVGVPDTCRRDLGRESD